MLHGERNRHADNDAGITHVRLAVRDGSPASRLERAVGEIVRQELQGTAALVDRLVAGTIALF